jgi:hypothetical protein
MKTINRKPLFLALAGITALGAAGAAQAVSVNPTGLGDFLFYPYYTLKGANNPYNTLISIVNTTASTKAVKIRFREGKASAEVLDFNIFLSPYDMWTGSIEPSASGGAKLFTNDATCTIPFPFPAAGVEFRNTAYVGDEAKDNSLARLREGYFEVIEMATYDDDSTVAINVKHGANRIPKDCTKITNEAAEVEAEAVQGGLSGTASLVSPGSGLNAATDAVALVKWRRQGEYFGTADPSPNIFNADTWSNTPTDDGNAVHAFWNNGADAVSAALMKAAIINEFVLDPGTASRTDWVITFPTKWAYVDQEGNTPSKLFTSPLSADGSCDPIIINTWDREEQTKQPAGDDFSPRPPQDETVICWEANVLTWNNHNIFSSTQTLGLDTLFINGWARIDFIPDNNPLTGIDTVGVVQNQNNVPFTTTGVGSSFTGLPVIGFAVQTFNPSLTTSYAGTFYHRFVSGAPTIFNDLVQ